MKMAGGRTVGAGTPGRRGGRRANHSRRDIVDTIRYVAHNNCVWRALPGDSPPWKTVYDYHAKWAADGTVTMLHNALREQVRVAKGRQPEASAALVDSQSVRRGRDRHHRAAIGRPRQCGLYAGRRRRSQAVVGDQLLLPPRQPGLGGLGTDRHGDL